MSQKQAKQEEKKTAVRRKPTKKSAPKSHQTRNPRTRLQQMVGNQALKKLSSQHAASTPHVQAKLQLNAVGDKYEQEADAVARNVVNQINAPQPVQRQDVEEEEPVMAKHDISVMRQEAAEEEEMMAQRQAEEDEELQAKPVQRQEEEEDMMAQRQEEEDEEPVMASRATQDLSQGGEVDTAVANRINQQRGGGHTLDDSVRGSMENAFGSDFSDVRVHTSAESNDLNESLQARAFTTGKDIFFKQGEYNPSTTTGQELLAHELTHVVQQSKIVRRQNSEHQIEMEETNIKSEGGFRAMAIHSIDNAHLIAMNNLEQFASEVQNACSAFENYALSKVKELEDKITGKELFGALIAVIGNVLVGSLATKITSEIGKLIFSSIGSQIVYKIKEAGKNATSNSDDAETLVAAVEAMSQGLKDLSTNLKTTVNVNLKPLTNEIKIKLNNNEPLTEQESQYLRIIYSAPINNINLFLESEFGVPNISSARELHLKLFSDLVAMFERKYIWLTSNFREKLEMGFAKDFGAEKLTLDYKVRNAKIKAAKQRKRAIDSSKKASKYFQ